jgi:hypothetical protein
MILMRYLEQLKKMGVEHIIFGYTFSSIGKNMNNMIEVTKKFTRFGE